MLELLGNYTGPLNINGHEFKNAEEAEAFLKDYNGGLTVTLPIVQGNVGLGETHIVGEPNKEDRWFRIEVQHYMTNYTKDFFLSELNPEGPMPFVIMVGRKLQETNKLVKMECYAELPEGRVSRCMRCGKPLFEKEYQCLGIGPECGASGYVELIRSGTDETSVRFLLAEKMKEVKWTGWIVKSAITNTITLLEFKR